MNETGQQKDSSAEADAGDDPRRPAGRWIEAALIVLQIALLVATRLIQPPALTDDAFIHFRNALNFAHGDGLAFNPGQWVIGTTSPIYALALGALHWATRLDLPELARWFNFACDAGLVLLLVWSLRRWGVGLWFRHALIFALSCEPLRMFYAASGMEMSFFLLATLGIVTLLGRDRWLAGGAMLGVLGWIRPEGAIVGLAIVAALAVLRRWKTLGAGVATAAVTASIAGGILLYFYGTIFPLSLMAKSGTSWFQDFSEPCYLIFFMNLARLTPIYATPAFSAEWATAGQATATAIVAAGQVALMGLGKAWLWRRGHVYAAGTLGGIVFGYYLFYAVTNPMIFDWYFVPFYFFSMLLAGIGWWAIVEWIAAKVVTRRRAGETQAGQRDDTPSGAREQGGPTMQAATTTQTERPVAGKVTAWGAVALAIVLWMAQANHAAEIENFAVEPAAARLTFRFIEPPPHDRIVLYIRAARVMDEWRGGQPLEAATPEIGAFAYYYRGPVLDPFGLVSPEALALGSAAQRADLPEAWREYHPFNIFLVERPAFVMMAGMFIPIGLPPAFEAEYEEVRRPDVPLLRIFVRRDLPEEVKAAARGTADRS